MIAVDSPLDDTVQLDEMAAEADQSNQQNFPADDDDVKILDLNNPHEEDLGVDQPERDDVDKPRENTRTPRRAFLTIAVLACINLLNYMDRFTVAGRLSVRSVFIDPGGSGEGVF